MRRGARGEERGEGKRKGEKYIHVHVYKMYIEHQLWTYCLSSLSFSSLFLLPLLSSLSSGDGERELEVDSEWDRSRRRLQTAIMHTP